MAAVVIGGLLAGVAAPARAQTEGMPFTVKIYPHNYCTLITIINESRERIIGFTITCGDTSKPFNRVWDGVYFSGPYGQTSLPTLVAPDYAAGGPTTDTLRFAEISSFDRGDQMSFWVGTDPYYVNTAQSMFNNGDKPNSVVTVFGADGGRGEMALPDTLYNTLDRTYSFATEERPRTLTVSSFTEGSVAAGIFVKNFSVTVRNHKGVVIEQYVNPSQNVVIQYLSDGDAVDIAAVEAVYMNSSGQFIYDSTTIPPVLGNDPDEQPRERYVATGISVNNTPLTGDPTQYRFDISDDTIVELRWGHEYALLINHDFLATKSDELDPSGNPWAGPLTSKAAGNPEPDTTQIHWVPRGQEVLAQVDGQVLDFTRPGLDIRYVPTGYRAAGSARGVFLDVPVKERDFVVGQAPPQRQQVDAFVMDNWAIIDYVWRIQYGVKINVDDTSRSALPRVFKVTSLDGLEEEIGSLEGTFWFYPNDAVKIASAANVAGPTSLALTGWVNGDGYYFSSSGEIRSEDGVLSSGGPTVGDSGPVAVWQPSFFDQNGKEYRGLSIPALQRPARVAWTYGNQSYTYEAQIGEYLFQNNESSIDEKPDLAAVVRTEPSSIEVISVSGNNKQVSGPEMAVWDPNALRLYPLVPGQFRVVWNTATETKVQVLVTAIPPARGHYPHIAGTPPVQLDPDPADTFIFKALCYSENNATISDSTLFTATSPGRAVLLFGPIQRISRGEPKD